VPSVLDFRIEMDVVRPTGIPSTEVVAASFGPAFGNAPGQRAGGNVALALPRDGCTAIANPSAVAGRIALIDRGTCGFTVKVKNAQNAGAAAVLIANNVPTGLPGMGGADPTVVIPSFGITQAAGAALRGAASGVYVELSRNPNNRAGTTAGFPRLFAPNPFQGGSSVSHWDTSATRNLLMEPSINSNLTKSVKNPEDLTRALFMDIGW
jgi:hypothetical protein